jgi:hypothetical protein
MGYVRIGHNPPSENESPDLLGLTRKLTYALAMQKPDTWYAYFHVSGSFAPDDVTRRIGVTPTETAREGDAIGTSAKSRPCSLWALHSRLGESAPLEEHVKDVLNQLDANKAAFVKLSRESDGTMQLVGYFRDVNPGVHFDLEIVERIAEYGLCIDCDFYNC